MPTPNNRRSDVPLLYIPDVIGIWKNSKLTTNELAENGYVCMVIDILNGDAIELNNLGDTDMSEWITHGSNGNNPQTPEAVDPIVVDAINTLKKEFGTQRIGSLGYCLCAKVRIFTGAVRGDECKREQRFARKGAFQQAVEWFNEYL